MIPRIPVDDAVRFMAEFYRPEQPVILSGVACNSDGGGEAVWERLRAQIAHDASFERRLLWFDAPPGVLEGTCATPAVITRLLHPGEAYVRPRFVRVWLHRAGNVTPWHYDGNSLHVFNLQLAGRKRWRIVSPQDPLSCIPFSNACLYANYALEGTRHHEFVLEEGEMLFLPRHWFHWVESLAPINVNVNWVLTPRQPAPVSATARRDAEILAFRRLIAVRERKNDAEDMITRDVSVAASLRRAAQETARLPLLALELPAQLMRLWELRRKARSG